jgi:hypothetical protein
VSLCGPKHYCREMGTWFGATHFASAAAS